MKAIVVVMMMLAGILTAGSAMAQGGIQTFRIVFGDNSVQSNAALSGLSSDDVTNVAKAVIAPYTNRIENSVQEDRKIIINGETNDLSADIDVTIEAGGDPVWVPVTNAVAGVGAEIPGILAVGRTNGISYLYVPTDNEWNNMSMSLLDALNVRFGGNVIVGTGSGSYDNPALIVLESAGGTYLRYGDTWRIYMDQTSSNLVTQVNLGDWSTPNWTTVQESPYALQGAHNFYGNVDMEGITSPSTVFTISIGSGARSANFMADANTGTSYFEYDRAKLFTADNGNVDFMNFTNSAFSVDPEGNVEFHGNVTGAGGASLWTADGVGGTYVGDGVGLYVFTNSSFEGYSGRYLGNSIGGWAMTDDGLGGFVRTPFTGITFGSESGGLLDTTIETPLTLHPGGLNARYNAGMPGMDPTVRYNILLPSAVAPEVTLSVPMILGGALKGIWSDNDPMNPTYTPYDAFQVSSTAAEVTIPVPVTMRGALKGVWSYVDGGGMELVYVPYDAITFGTSEASVTVPETVPFNAGRIRTSKDINTGVTRQEFKDSMDQYITTFEYYDECIWTPRSLRFFEAMEISGTQTEGIFKVNDGEDNWTTMLEMSYADGVKVNERLNIRDGVQVSGISGNEETPASADFTLFQVVEGTPSPETDAILNLKSDEGVKTVTVKGSLVAEDLRLNEHTRLVAGDGSRTNAVEIHTDAAEEGSFSPVFRVDTDGEDTLELGAWSGLGELDFNDTPVVYFDDGDLFRLNERKLSMTEGGTERWRMAIDPATTNLLVQANTSTNGTPNWVTVSTHLFP